MNNIEAVAIIANIASVAKRFAKTTQESDAIDDATKLAIKALHGLTEIAVYDSEEIHENCTVQVLKNTKTGAVSVGWWKNRKE